MNDDKVEQAVLVIFRRTHEDSLVWEMKPTPENWRRGTDIVYAQFFETYFDRRRLALYQTRFPYGRMQRLANEAFGDMPAATWGEKVHLALLGENDEILFEFPSSSLIRDLFITVQYKTAAINEFLDEILETDKTETEQVRARP